MSAAEVVAILLAGLAAGTINTVVGSGTLITFPTLLFFGYPPVAANVSNSLGLVAGSLSGAWGYRAELRRTRALVVRLAPVSVAGAVLGALLLLWLPASAFEAIVPVLIVLALVLVVGGPRLTAWAARRRGADPAVAATGLGTGRWVALLAGVLLAGAYGGYFGAAQGVLMLGLMSVLLPVGLQEMNGMKNVLTMLVNLVAAVVFLVVQPEQIVWPVAGLIAAGALLGGVVGARVGRSMPPALLRAVIVVIGSVAVAVLLTT